MNHMSSLIIAIRGPTKFSDILFAFTCLSAYEHGAPREASNTPHNQSKNISRAFREHSRCTRNGLLMDPICGSKNNSNTVSHSGPPLSSSAKLVENTYVRVTSMWPNFLGRLELTQHAAAIHELARTFHMGNKGQNMILSKASTGAATVEKFSWTRKPEALLT